MRKLTSFITSLLILLVPIFLLFPFPVFAQPITLPTTSYAKDEPLAEDVVDIYALQTLFANILAVATALAGLAVFVMLITGGFKWMTSRGDPKKLESARNTITYAVIGLVLMILAWLILRFIQEFTNVPVTIFQLPKAP